MTLVSDILTRAGRQCSIKPPDSWVNATGDQHVEFRDVFLFETVEDILDRVDVPHGPRKAQTITGDGSQSYDLDTNFYRMHRDKYAVYESTSSRRPCIPVQTDGEWDYIQEFGAAGSDRFYRLRGYNNAQGESTYQIEFFDALATGEEVVCHFNTSEWMYNPFSSNLFTEYTQDNLHSRIPRLILEAGLVYKFRERKGLDFNHHMMKFEARLARWGNDWNARSVNMGLHSARKPWDLPVPDTIPSS